MTDCKIANVPISTRTLLNSTILKYALEYMKRYNVSALDAFTRYANSLYDFSKAHNQTTATRQNYTKRISMLITEKSLALSNSEIKAIYLFFDGAAISIDSNIEDFEKQLKTEIAEKNAYEQKLIDSTEEQRNLTEHSPLMLTDDIMKYIEYWNTFKDEQYLLYNNLYVLGYISGKRAERVRRKSIN